MDKKRDFLKEGKRSIEEGEYQKARYYLKKALEENPDYPDINNLMGVALSLSGRYKEAVKYFKKAVKLNPKYSEAHVNYALTLNQLGKLDEASEEFEKAEELEIKRESEAEKVEFSVRARIANSHKDIATLYASIDRFNEAIDELERALKFAPNFHDIRTFLGEMYMKKGELANAKDTLKEVLNRSGDYIPAAVKLGQCYYDEEDFEMAREIWEKAKEIDPEDKSVKMHLNLLKEK